MRTEDSKERKKKHKGDLSSGFLGGHVFFLGRRCLFLTRNSDLRFCFAILFCTRAQLMTTNDVEAEVVLISRLVSAEDILYPGGELNFRPFLLHATTPTQ